MNRPRSPFVVETGHQGVMTYAPKVAHPHGLRKLVQGPPGNTLGVLEVMSREIHEELRGYAVPQRRGDYRACKAKVLRQILFTTPRRLSN